MQTKLWYQSKAVWLNLISLIVVALESTEITNLVADEYAKFVAAGVLMLNLVVRFFFTESPVAMTEKRAEKTDVALGLASSVSESRENRNALKSLLIFALVGSLAFAPACSKRVVPELPSVPETVLTGSVREIAMTAVVSLEEMGDVVSQLAQMEDQAWRAGGVPTPVHTPIDNAIDSLSARAVKIIDDIEKGVLDTAPKIRAAINDLVAPINALIAMFNGTTVTLKERLKPLAELVGIIVGGFLAAQGGAFSGAR